MKRHFIQSSLFNIEDSIFLVFLISFFLKSQHLQCHTWKFTICSNVFWWFQTWEKPKLLLYKVCSLCAWLVNLSDLYLELYATVLKNNKTTLNKYSVDLFFCTEDINRLTVQSFAYIFLLFQPREGDGWFVTYVVFQSLIFLPLYIKKWNSEVVRLYKPQTVISIASADT